MQVVGTRLLCMGRTTELLGAEEKGEAERILKLEKSLKERDDVIIDVTIKMKSKEEEVGKLQVQICLLQSQMKESDNDKGRMTSRIHELENEVLEMFSAGFDQAVSQVVTFAPEFYVGNLDVTKIVVNGKLVDDEIGEAEDENMATGEKDN
ncbi:uncharacterized protein LOC107634835 [Arachis ipaensis]|uniref:uncharacterized protein LOC107634835 n=1 Tax=Arachis ipaensis TaxID=130454 RepID=UPI0007AFA802|nr:uncharacterized protein LOC107634835 [Arachis ipaensis]XP_016193738.1 uncharacterized protein LOC107634835 [Arachis ipaensis]XP_025640268.1 uncharacterized protein LOC112734944 [Arachis hypogaea]QHO04473.1 uncharacterized protein DS421_13g440610 [Arachis hypogaea]